MLKSIESGKTPLDPPIALGDVNLIFWFAYRGRVTIFITGWTHFIPIIAGQTVLFLILIQKTNIKAQFLIGLKIVFRYHNIAPPNLSNSP